LYWGEKIRKGETPPPKKRSAGCGSNPAGSTSLRETATNKGVLPFKKGELEGILRGKHPLLKSEAPVAVRIRPGPLP